MAEAAAARPSIVGKALNEIAKQDSEVLDTVLEVMEVENLLSSEASVDILPNSSNVLVQLGEQKKPFPSSSSGKRSNVVTATRIERSSGD